MEMKQVLMIVLGSCPRCQCWSCSQLEAMLESMPTSYYDNLHIVPRPCCQHRIPTHIGFLILSSSVFASSSGM